MYTDQLQIERARKGAWGGRNGRTQLPFPSPPQASLLAQSATDLSR